MEADDKDVLALSLAKFGWKTSGDIGRLTDLFDEELRFVHITGHVSSKEEWIEEMRSGRFVYERIESMGASVEMRHDIAVLSGKAVFTVRMGGHRGSYRLQFTENYVRKSGA
jgi:hypothetical protein